MALALFSRSWPAPSAPVGTADYIGRGSNPVHHVVDQMVSHPVGRRPLTPASVREHGMAVHLSELLMAAVNLARRFAAPGSGVSVRTQESDKDAFVWGDPNALKHALAEIIANALNFSPQGAEVVLSQWAAGDNAVITIVDQGPGIPPQQLANALREFHQIDRSHYEQQGMGLGLPLARRLIEVHGGTLDIQSVVGRARR